MTCVHPFDDVEVIAGHASCGLEILEELPNVGTIVIPVGGGGLSSGIAAAVAASGSEAAVWGVEPEGAPAMSQSLEAGEAIRLDSVDTIADGLAAPMAGVLNHAILAEHARGLADQMELARRYMAAGQYKRAAQIRENAMEWHSSNTELINELAVARLNLRDPAGARDLLLRAAEIDDAHVTTRINLAACHMGLGLFDSALEYIDRAVVLAPDVPRVYFTRSGVLKALGRDADALEALAEAARLDPMSAIYRLHLGDTSAKLGLRAQAKDHFRASASIDPSMLAPQLGLAELCLADGDTACAREAYEQAKRIAPNDPRVLELTARIERH